MPVVVVILLFVIQSVLPLVVTAVLGDRVRGEWVHVNRWDTGGVSPRGKMERSLAAAGLGAGVRKDALGQQALEGANMVDLGIHSNCEG